MSLDVCVVDLNLRLSVNDAKSLESCGFCGAKSLYIWRNATQGNHSEKHSKKDGNNVASLVRSVEGRVVKLLINPDGADKEGVGVAEVDREKEEAKVKREPQTLVRSNRVVSF